MKTLPPAKLNLLDVRVAQHIELFVLDGPHGGVDVVGPGVEPEQEVVVDDRPAGLVVAMHGYKQGVVQQSSPGAAWGFKATSRWAALAEAQSQGYAEADPTLDVSGWDAAHKAIILASLALAAAISAIHAADRPNFVIILADDLGWRDVGFAGNRDVDTPCLDALAKRGTVFTKACASAPNCAPTRACLLTGQYPPRHGVYTVVDDRHAPGSPEHKIIAATSRDALPTESITLAEALKSSGYATGMFGMWNLGRGRSGPTTPTGQGFDVFIEPKQLGFEKDAYRDESGRYSPDVLTDSALKWMDSVKDRPFFLYLAFHDVHAPYDPKPELLVKYQKRGGVENPAKAATVEAMDANVGRLMAALDQADWPEVTGTIAGDDTVLVVAPDAKTADALRARFAKFLK